MNRQTGKKVFVGLSGGVDSAVSAALLKKEGYDVTGVFIKAWTPSFANDGVDSIASRVNCTWQDDRRSAMRAAAVLDIPFITLDLEKEYKQSVVDYMIGEYRKGRTPNPDVMCNKEIKFGEFLKWAKKQGANYIATGHYARTLPLGEGRVGLLEGKDKNKDQSYFLWTLNQNQLKHTLFPVGNLKKDKVRELAERFGLPQAERKDSQGLCFLGQIDMKEFLSQYTQPRKGGVLDMSGKIVGTHNGAAFFTIGERHGFTITKKTDQDEPLYVIEKDIKANTITVAPKKEHQEAPLTLDEVNWISGNINTLANLGCRTRYRQKKIPCKVETRDTETIVNIDEADYVSPGQSLVFYDNDTCLGGGIVR